MFENILAGERELAERERALEALRRSEERFRMLADNISQLAWTCDLLGNVTWYNKRWLDYTGLSFEDMKGWGWSKVQHPDHVDRVVARVKRSGETGEPWEDTFPLRGKDGQYRWFLSRAMPIRDDQGNFVQWFGTNTDVTEQVLAEEKVAQQARELRALNERLQELDRAKTTFFSNVSHEFRTPLTLMLGPLDELMARAARDDLERLGTIRRNGQRLLKLVNTMLDFARIEAGRTQAAYAPTDLAALTADLASNFRAACEKAGLILEVDCPANVQGWVDRELWEKIVLNLISNAFKFTMCGRITVRVLDAGESLRLVVSDTGIGIPQESIGRIFERFHRIEGARGRSHEGSGIGLALVQELVKLHGGTINVASVQGRGTTFTVEIPKGNVHLPHERLITPDDSVRTNVRTDPYVAEALGWLPGEQTAMPASRAGRILVADDNADLRDYARRLLCEHYEVETVNDGLQALAAARARRPDLIVTDVMMPQLDGFGLIHALRMDPDLDTIPVIVLSARAGEEARLEGLHRGADDYLVKPFSARELLGRVAAMLQSDDIRRRALEALRQSREALREADRRKDEFLATLSHELRNPLAPLANGLHVLRLKGDDVAAIGPLREIMERQLHHLVRLVDDLLEMSRITRGTFELRRERVALATLVRNAVETSEPHVRAGRHRLDLDLPDEPLWLEGDPVRLAQIVSNLLNNAAKYTDDGGSITLAAAREGDHAVIRVRDNGCGIAPDALSRIFEMFSRESPAGGRAQSGLGIGLTLARRLAEMHGGTIEARSEGLGRGAEFVVRLPLAEATERTTASGKTPAALSPMRILVVDDNRDAATSLAVVLRMLGSDVRVAHDGHSAIDAFASSDPAVVLLDIGMPGMNGYEVARTLRARFPERRAALVALTGWGQEDDLRKAREAGIDHHLIKPADVEALQELLMRIDRTRSGARSA
jgi:PAS domain S-box-containing protein